MVAEEKRKTAEEFTTELKLKKDEFHLKREDFEWKKELEERVREPVKAASSPRHPTGVSASLPGGGRVLDKMLRAHCPQSWKV